MPDIEQFTDDELLVLAHEWRRRAMHGEKDARGVAHTLEVEIHCRVGNPKASFESLETRPLEARVPKPWWSLW